MSSISGFKSSAKKRKPVLRFIDESLVFVFYSFYITGTFLLKMVSGLLVIGQPKYVVAAALGSPPIFLRPSLFSVSHQISKCRGLQRTFSEAKEHISALATASPKCRRIAITQPMTHGR